MEGLEKDFNEAAARIKQDTSEFVEEDVTGELKAAIYNSEAGKAIDDKSVIKSDGEVMGFVEGIGETAGTIGLGYLTGGGLATAALAGVEGAGGAVEETLKSTDDFDAAIKNGIVTGAWDFTQWVTGAKVAGNSVKSVLTDVVFGALDPLAKAAADVATTGKEFGQAYEEQGGIGASISTAIKAGLFSAGSEILQAASNKAQIGDGKKAEEPKVVSAEESSADIKLSVGDTDTKCTTPDMTSKIDTAKEKMIDFFKNGFRISDGSRMYVDPEKLEHAMAEQYVCKTNEEFADIVRQKGVNNANGGTPIGLIAAFCEPSTGITYYRPNNSVEDIVHEMTHNTGGMKYNGIRLTGMDEGMTDLLACVQTGEKGSAGYALARSGMSVLTNRLDQAGYKNLTLECFLQEDCSKLKTTVNSVLNDEKAFDTMAEKFDTTIMNPEEFTVEAVTKWKETTTSAYNAILSMCENIK